MSSVTIVDAPNGAATDGDDPQFELFQAMAIKDLIPFNAVAKTIRMAEVIVSDALVEKLLAPIQNSGVSPHSSDLNTRTR